MLKKALTQRKLDGLTRLIEAVRERVNNNVSTASFTFWGPLGNPLLRSKNREQLAQDTWMAIGLDSLEKEVGLKGYKEEYRRKGGVEGEE
ncbi:hypothetical protein PAAG_11246 [Paracoccidioides lutzii Pb01]|uniref:Uncharacterized protein n=1 Tax=Paracoccidioides lutzii (strain ATCC MYA-826 / Pb01) TaxID=502779 RepID=A0A0A2V7J7_PARBA|nr:hypothetical protein PAAG_11246 [Paracoccidioides lutzii Pb01]KGQ02065.1 hypothetical protein PAAG_11246 [Paracoccidioides lutzii Pb01]